MYFPQGSRFLVVAAHPDDEVLGFGATAATLAATGREVGSCIVAGNAEARGSRPDTSKLQADTAAASHALGMAEPIVGSFPNIRLNAVPHLDLVEFIEAAIVATGATVVVTHHPSDVNDDHTQVSRACQAAARLPQRRPEMTSVDVLLFMEILSSTEWRAAGAAPPFDPGMYVEVGEAGVAAKLEALSRYEGVMRPYPHPRSEEAVRSLAALRGSESGLDYAEAFQIGFMHLRSDV